jgi:hypothetical protein
MRFFGHRFRGGYGSSQDNRSSRLVGSVHCNGNYNAVLLSVAMGEVYEVDHKIPFAKHGWHTMDNLRVIRRDANRRKGGSEPKLEDWLRIWRRKDEV